MKVSEYCSAYVAVLVISLFGGVVARFSENDTAERLAETFFSFLICCSPLVFILQVIVMIDAIGTIGFLRNKIWKSWLVNAGVGVLFWTVAVLSVFLCAPLLRP